MLQASIRHGVPTKDIAKHLHALECFQNSKKEGGGSSVIGNGTRQSEVDGDGDHHGDRVKDKEDKENLSQVVSRKANLKPPISGMRRSNPTTASS